LLEVFKKIVPRRIRNAAKLCAQRSAFEYAFRRVAAIAPNKIPSRELLDQLRRGWGNQGWSGRTAYLEEVVKWAAITPGPVLECGSGLTTILLGLYAGRRGVPLWTLEHDFAWHKRIANVLSDRHISSVNLSLAPLRDFGSFSWYAPPLTLMPAEFKLVVCDGPPERTTRGKRFGLLPVMGKRLASNCVILLDDLNIELEDNVIDHWAAERVAMTKILKADESQSFGLIFLE
jgi:Methyltransferase domain